MTYFTQDVGLIVLVGLGVQECRPSWSSSPSTAMWKKPTHAAVENFSASALFRHSNDLDRFHHHRVPLVESHGAVIRMRQAMGIAVFSGREWWVLLRVFF